MNGINDADMLIDLASKDIKTIIQKNESQVLQPNYKLINRTLLIGIYKLQAITINSGRFFEYFFFSIQNRGRNGYGQSYGNCVKISLRKQVPS